MFRKSVPKPATNAVREQPAVDPNRPFAGVARRTDPQCRHQNARDYLLGQADGDGRILAELIKQVLARDNDKSR